MRYAAALALVGVTLCLAGCPDTRPASDEEIARLQDRLEEKEELLDTKRAQLEEAEEAQGIRGILGDSAEVKALEKDIAYLEESIESLRQNIREAQTGYDPGWKRAIIIGLIASLAIMVLLAIVSQGGIFGEIVTVFVGFLVLWIAFSVIIKVYF
jgi:ferredoxin